MIIARKLTTTSDPVILTGPQPTAGQVLTATDANHAIWADSSGGGGGGVATALVGAEGSSVEIYPNNPDTGMVLTATSNTTCEWGTLQPSLLKNAENAIDVSTGPVAIAGTVLTCTSDGIAQWVAPSGGGPAITTLASDFVQGYTNGAFVTVLTAPIPKVDTRYLLRLSACMSTPGTGNTVQFALGFSDTVYAFYNIGAEWRGLLGGSNVTRFTVFARNPNNGPGGGGTIFIPNGPDSGASYLSAQGDVILNTPGSPSSVSLTMYNTGGGNLTVHRGAFFELIEVPS